MYVEYSIKIFWTYVFYKNILCYLGLYIDKYIDKSKFYGL